MIKLHELYTQLLELSMEITDYIMNDQGIIADFNTDTYNNICKYFDEKMMQLQTAQALKLVQNDWIGIRNQFK